MNSFARIPTFLFLFVWLGFLGWKFYDFNNSPEGELEAHRTQVKEMKKNLQTLKEKLKEGEAFVKTLDAKREELRSQARKLSEYQGALSEQMDTANLVKLLLTEAKKLELHVERIEPGRIVSQPFYSEHQYNLELRGGFQQFLLFMLRISKMQRILRIADYRFRISSVSMSPRSMTLDGRISVSSYQYTQSQEDALGRESLSAPASGGNR